MATKIYTKTGDDGTTGLFGGARAPKYDLRVEAYGTVDELNCALGAALAGGLPGRLQAEAETISALLFTLGADLATPLKPPPSYPIPRIQEAHIVFLENLIDACEAELPPLKQFILPGGSPAAAGLHLARAVCRRAERRATELAARERINDATIKFLNRLSDYLFVAARLANSLQGVSDALWNNPAL